MTEIKIKVMHTLNWAVTTSMIGFGIASFWNTELINFVGFYTVFMTILGIFIIIIYEATHYVYTNNYPDRDKLKPLYLKVREGSSNLVRRVISISCTVVVLLSLIYQGWFITAGGFLVVTLWIEALRNRMNEVVID